jgi:hypothetical protein
VNFPVDAAKATEAVARILEKSGADVDYLRVVKLVYLADRTSILARGIPIVGGKYFSMRKGPTVSEVMDFAKARNAPGWRETIKPLVGHKMNLATTPDYLDLSERELEIIDAVVAAHFHRSTDDLVDWCHDHCGEYESVMMGRKPIAVETMLKVEGKSPERTEQVLRDAKEVERLDSILSRV